MAYTELDLAQVERRVLAGERCVARQKEALKRHIDSALPTDAPLQLLAECEARLLDLRNNRNKIRNEIAAANTQQLLDMFWLLPSRHGSLRDAIPGRNQHRQVS